MVHCGINYSFIYSTIKRKQRIDAIFRTSFSCFICQVLYTDYSPPLPPPLLSVIAFLRRSMRVIVESHINDVINSSVRRERDRPPVHMYVCMYVCWDDYETTSRYRLIIGMNSVRRLNCIFRFPAIFCTFLSLRLVKTYVYRMDERKKIYTYVCLMKRRSERIFADFSILLKPIEYTLDLFVKIIFDVKGRFSFALSLVI